MRAKSFEKKSGFHLTVSKMRLVCECANVIGAE